MTFSNIETHFCIRSVAGLYYHLYTKDELYFSRLAFSALEGSLTEFHEFAKFYRNFSINLSSLILDHSMRWKCANHNDRVCTSMECNQMCGNTMAMRM